MGRASRLPHSCEPWAMFAMPFPENLADAAMAEAERMANDPMPGSKCPARIIALEREIEELSRVEEALVEAAIARIERRSHWAGGPRSTAETRGRFVSRHGGHPA